MKSIIYISIFLIFGASKLFACDCIKFSNAYLYNNAEKIFEGKVIKVKRNEKKYVQKVKFEIRKKYRGEFENGTIEIETGLGRGDCGLNIFKEEIWLIFSKRGKSIECDGSIPIKMSPYSQSNVLNYLNVESEINSIIKQDNELHLELDQDKRTFTKGFYKNRLPIGKWEYYQYYSDENNKVQSSLLISNYKNGLKDGEEIRINEHNRITNKTLYKRGLKNGKSNSFNNDGTVWESGKYKNGKKIGDWLIYHDNGNVEYFYRYDSEGRKIYDEKRSENGELIYYHITRYTRKFKYSDLYENGKLVKKYKFKIRKNS